MTKYKFAIAVLTSLALCAAAHTQTTAATAATTAPAATPAAPPLSPAVAHYIDVTVRNHFSIAPEMNLVISAPSPGDIPGYNNVLVTVFNNGKPTGKVTMLLSADQKTLLGVVKFDLTRPLDASIPVAGRPVRGNAESPVKVIVFDDLQCPYCAMMHQHMFPGLYDLYKGKVAFIYKDFPLTDIHPWAMHAAVDVNCLASQNSPNATEAYWKLVDAIHTHLEQIEFASATVEPAKDKDGRPIATAGVKPTIEVIYGRLDKMAKDQAAASGLDQKAVATCLHDQVQTGVDASVKFADSLNLDATPTLYVDGEKIDGVTDIDVLKDTIDRALKAHGIEPPPRPAAPAAAAPAAN